MENDKPFSCPIPGCGMTFVNEDHLTVHRQKHDLSLSLTPNTAFKTTTFYDQTPTPTRFLSALESELFNDLHSDNPFDATFRRANSLVATNGEIPGIAEPGLLSISHSNTEPLNTPSIILPSDDVRTPPVCQTKSVISLKQPTPRIEVNCEPVSEETPTLPFSPKSNILLPGDNAEITEKDDLLHKDVASSNLPLSMDQKKLILTQNGRDTVVQTPVITSVGNHGKPSATCVPTAVVVTRTQEGNATTLSSNASQIPVMSVSPSLSAITDNVQQICQPDSVSSVLQLVIRLPDGQSMPISLPVSVAPTQPTTNANRFKSIASQPSKSLSPHSATKKRLKEVLKKNLPITMNPPPEVPSASEVYLFNNCSLSQNESESPPSSPISVGRPGASGRRRRALDDPDDRRIKSLERNRAAATRCRQKRKQWITSLESKAAEMAKVNQHLQNEVTMLRNEVTQLKAMLLAHKDCPVTQQQKASRIPQIVKVVSYGSQPVQQPTPRNVTTVPVVELMDVETSSSQSGYISDTSELSTRDR